MNKSILGGIAIALTSIASITANAAAPAAPAQGTTVKKAPRLADKLTASYTHIFLGPALTDPTSSVQPDNSTGDRDLTSPVNTRNIFSLGYKLTDVVSLGASLEYRISPVREHSTDFRDPVLKVSHSSVLKRGNFNMSADLRFGVAVGDTSRTKGRYTTIASKQISSYDIPNTRWTLGLTTYGEYHVWGMRARNASAAKPYEKKTADALVYATPSIDYKLRNNLSVNFAYEMDLSHALDTETSRWASAGEALDVGLSWDITPSINFNPLVEAFPTKRFALDTTTINAVIAWKLL